jgi:hypothetical protein
MEWDHGLDDTPGSNCHFMPLLRLHAHISDLQFEFVSYKLAAGYTPETDLCWYCIEQYEAEERGDDDWVNSVEECYCAPFDLSYEDWQAYHSVLIERTQVLRGFIHNKNEKWLDAVRQDEVDVRCVFGKAVQPITFRISCKTRFCEESKKGDAICHAEDAWSLLQEWGIFDLPHGKEMTFVVVFEGEHKIMKGDFEVTSSEVREVRIARGG